MKINHTFIWKKLRQKLSVISSAIRVGKRLVKARQV